MQGEDDLDDKLLREMADKAVSYISAFSWCEAVHEKYFGDGFGGIFALFLFRLSIRKIREPKWVWVIVGDISSSYLEAEGFPTAHSAFKKYLEGVEDWIDTPTSERDSRGDLPPLCAPRGPEYIEMLRSRLSTLRESFLPYIKVE